MNSPKNVIFQQASIKQRWKSAAIFIPLVLLLCTANLFYGRQRLQAWSALAVESWRVGIVQGNIPQDEKWSRDQMSKIFQVYQQETVLLEEQGVQFILWPEAALPFTPAFKKPALDVELGNFKVPLLVGAITYPEPGDTRFYNSALVVAPDKKILDLYHKKHLVPFGEYIPYKKLLFFVNSISDFAGELEAGATFRPVEVLGKQLGVLICYEDVFPEIAREMVNRGAQALINLTNDAWYGNSSAAYQHQVFSQLRSIETRRFLLRATNTGLSSAIAPTGEVLWQGPMFEREAFLSDLKFYTEKSFYVRQGDVFALATLILTLLFIAAASLRKKGYCHG